MEKKGKGGKLEVEEKGSEQKKIKGNNLGHPAVRFLLLLLPPAVCLP